MLYGDIINKTSCAVGVVTNSVILYCIRNYTQISLGAYKQLLTIFASYDLFSTVLHEFVDPKIFIINGSLGVSSNSMVADRRLPSFYLACFTVPFVLKNIHFLYRYWSVSWPNLIPLFSKTPFVVFLVSISVCVLVAWSAICYYGTFGEENDDVIEMFRSQFEIRFGRNKTQGFLVMNWVRNGLQLTNIAINNRTMNRRCLFLILLDSFMIISFLLALTLAFLTFRGIRQSMKISQMKNNFQMKLFIAVSAQTIVPLVCVYIPYFSCLTLTYYGMPAGAIAGK